MDVTFADDVDSAVAGETVRLTTNLFRILDKAKSVDNASELTSPSDEFMYRWVNDACNESDETLQEMWARVLTGEMGASGGDIEAHALCSARADSRRGGEVSNAVLLCHV